MRGTQRSQIAGPVGLCFLALLFLRLAWIGPAGNPGANMTHPLGLRPLRGPADEALREARLWHLRAMQAVSAQFEALEAWDPEAPEGRDPALWRQLMAKDPKGHLRRAREVARRSLSLAHTTQETYQAALMLARMECEAGDHKAELQRARQVMALEPKNPLSFITLHRAAECNRLEPLVQQLHAQMEAERRATIATWVSARRAAERESGAPAACAEGEASSSCPAGEAVLVLRRPQ